MEEKENITSKSNLPVVQKDKELLAEGVKNDRSKRIFRIIKGATLGTLGVVAGLALPGPLLASSLPLIASAGLGLGAIGGGFYAAVKYYNEAVTNSLYKIEDDLMFLGKQERDGSLGIYQSTRLNLAEHMKGYTNREKAGMMQLQGLIGFSRHKDNLANSSYTVRPDGTKVYDQLFSTKTHSINLSTFEAMEALGLIEVVKKDDKIGRTLFTRQPKEKKSLLIIPKLGFKNTKDLKEIGKAFLRGDRKTLEEKKETMEKWTFKLTDKPIDFADMYAKYQGLIPCESVQEKNAIKKFCMIFNSKHGILTKKDIDIGKDEFGRDVLLYDREENFAARTDREIDREALLKQAIAEGRKLNMPAIRAEAQAKREAAKKSEISEFDKSLRQGVDQNKVNAVLEEHREEVRRDLSDDGKLNGSTRQTDDKSDNDKKKDLEGTEQSL